MSVEHQARNLEEQFSDIEVATYDEIKKCQIDTDQFKTRLIALPLAYKDEHKAFLQKFNSDLDSPDLFVVWEKLNRYWSFLNYTMLENLIQRLGYKDLIIKMKAYVKALQSFRQNTRLCDFSKCYPSLREKETNLNLKEVVIHYHLEWETCTLEDLDIKHGHVLRKFHLPVFATTLKEILRGSVAITWSLPKEFVSHTKEQLKNPDMMEFCKEHCILSISVDGVKCHYSDSASGNGKW